jgi:predicted DNA-binding antitoxin AbrB/MazE fold protein
MTTTVEAIYEKGVLKPSEALDLPEQSKVKVTIEIDTARREWLNASQQALLKTWDNEANDVFNELRNR